MNGWNGPFCRGGAVPLGDADVELSGVDPVGMGPDAVPGGAVPVGPGGT
jgi:hypothetical protein